MFVKEIFVGFIIKYFKRGIGFLLKLFRKVYVFYIKKFYFGIYFMRVVILTIILNIYIWIF